MREAHDDDASRSLMQEIAKSVARLLAGMSIDGKVPAFTVLIWPHGQPGNRVNYVSNVPRAERDQIRRAMAAVQERWEQPRSSDRMTMARPVDPSAPRRGLRRELAAIYLGVSPSLFDHLVADGTLPQPKRLHGAVVWDRLELDISFEAIPAGERRPRKRARGEGIDP